MPLTETIIGGAAGGIGGLAASQSLQPLVSKMTDAHRYMLLVLVVTVLLLWFVLLPGNTKRKLRV